jgi:hypothetical protein
MKEGAAKKQPATHCSTPFLQVKNKIGKTKNEQSEVFKGSLE